MLSLNKSLFLSKIFSVKNLIQIFFIVYLSGSMISCKSETGKIAERTAVVDSTITLFQKKLLSSQIDSVFAKNKLNGSVAVFQNGESLYQKQKGYKNFKAKSKIDSNTVFAIGSLSKQFTAVLILQLVDGGRLNLNDKISKYLPDFQNKEYENITVHQLLTHTSGLHDSGNKLLFKSGTDFNYSNKGYLTLGKIIENITGKSYDQNAAELFKKAGMAHTSTANLYQPNQDFAGANIGSESNAQSVENMPNRLDSDDISIAAGGILSTIGDLNRWNNALFGGKLLKPESLKKFKTKTIGRPHYVLGTVGYGYGIMMNLAQPESYFHTGYVKGSPSLNVYYPATKTSVIILSNFANESLGKEAFFQPHAEIKKATDALENAVVAVRKEMAE